MNNLQPAPLWKKTLKLIALALGAAVILDWMLDGRLRARLPFRRNRAEQQPPR